MTETRLRVRNEEFYERASEIWNRANFIRDVGYELVSLEPGRCESRLIIADKHLQQNSFVHAGVVATMADHTGGAAGGSLIAANEVVLTLEFKVNLLRPAVGEELRCVATVLKNGRTVIVSESEVFTVKKGREKLAAKATVTLAVVGASYE